MYIIYLLRIFALPAIQCKWCFFHTCINFVQQWLKFSHFEGSIIHKLSHFEGSIILGINATFKVRKFESFFYKINTCLHKTTTCMRLQAEQILLVNIQYRYFSILGVASVVPFLCYFQKSQLIVVKRIWTSFCCIILLYL